jgi:hypothetical protein
MNPLKLGLLEILLVIGGYLCYTAVRSFWPEFLYFSTMTPYWLRQWTAERFGFSIGSCKHCGYNLKANQSGICPECGQTADPITPLREVERPPTLWSRWLLTTAAAAFTFIALVLIIILW